MSEMFIPKGFIPPRTPTYEEGYAAAIEDVMKCLCPLCNQGKGFEGSFHVWNAGTRQGWGPCQALSIKALLHEAKPNLSKGAAK